MDKKKMLKNLFGFLILVGLILFLSYQKEPHTRGENITNAKGLGAEFIVEKSNVIMKDIYNEVLKLQDKYFEIEYFAETYKHIDGKEVNHTSCQGYCPPFELAKIEYQGPFYLNISFSESSWDPNTYSSPAPLKEIYIDEIKHYLSLNLGTDNTYLRDDLLKIMNKL